MLSSSIADIIMLSQHANQNFRLAARNKQDSWHNPVGVISSARRPELSLFQVSSDIVADPSFNSEDFSDECRLAVWSMFRRNYPQHAQRESGSVYDVFGPGGSWPNPYSPKFIMQEGRYKTYLEQMKVKWAVGHSALMAVDKTNFELKPVLYQDIVELAQTKKQKEQEFKIFSLYFPDMYEDFSRSFA